MELKLACCITVMIVLFVRGGKCQTVQLDTAGEGVVLENSSKSASKDTSDANSVVAADEGNSSTVGSPLGITENSEVRFHLILD